MSDSTNQTTPETGEKAGWWGRLAGGLKRTSSSIGTALDNLLTGREHLRLQCALHGIPRAERKARAQELLELLKRADAFRRPGRFAELLEVARLAGGIDGPRLERAHQAAAAVNAGEIASRASLPSEIPDLIDQARLRAISDQLADQPDQK